MLVGAFRPSLCAGGAQRRAQDETEVRPFRRSSWHPFFVLMPGVLIVLCDTHSLRPWINAIIISTPLCRAKFSVQIRDFLDLVVTRLSDLNGQGDARRRLLNTAGSGDPRGAVLARARSGVGESDGDPSRREVGY